MAIPQSGLTETDYEILKYVSRFESISITQLQNHFSKKVSSFDLRLSLLSKPNYDYNSPFPTPNTTFIDQDYTETSGEDGDTVLTATGIYSISALGKKALQDYQVGKKSRNRLIWKEKAWIPIIVSLATNLVINGLKWLLPLIQQWFANAL